MTKKKQYKRYSAEFKRETLRQAAEEGATDKQVCGRSASAGGSLVCMAMSIEVRDC